jgi:hypothetical protein
MAGTITDSRGSAVLRAPAGDYYLRALLIGYHSGAAKVRIRAGAIDSVWVELDERVVCD